MTCPKCSSPDWHPCGPWQVQCLGCRTLYVFELLQDVWQAVEPELPEPDVVVTCE